MAEVLARETGFAEVNGATLYYEAAGAGHPLCMLHGHLLDSGQWDTQFAAFARHYRVIRYDERGYGQSSTPTEPFAHHEDLRALLAFLGIEHAYIMGCSGGGAAAIDFALAYPGMADALILVGAALSGYPPSAPDAQMGAIDAAYERGDIEQTVELLLQRWTDGVGRAPEQVNPQARTHIRAMTTHLLTRPTADEHERSLEPPAFGRLGEIQAPALAIVGANDLPRIIDVASRVEQQAPRARKVVMPDAGHHPNIEHPDQFNQIVLDFLAGIG